jgi:hypothetical protein
MNGRVGRVNLRSDQVLIECVRAHTGITDTASFVQDDCVTHNLHLNSRSMRRLIYVTAERVGGGHVSSVSSIPAITHARASPFLV